MFEVHIRTKLPENCALGCLREIARDCVLKIEGLAVKDESVRGLLRLKARRIEEIISNLPPQCEALITSERDARILLKEHSCFVALPLIESGCILTSVEIKDNSVTWKAICSEEDFLKLIEKLESGGVEFEISYKAKPSGKSEITFREEEVLRFAFEKGYFDFPKKIKLEEVAEHFGIAPSTLSEILRRALKKVLEKYFGEPF